MTSSLLGGVTYRHSEMQLEVANKGYVVCLCIPTLLLGTKNFFWRGFGHEELSQGKGNSAEP